MPVYAYDHKKEGDLMRTRTALYLDTDVLKELKKISEKTGVPVSEIMRRALAEYLKKQARKGKTL